MPWIRSGQRCSARPVPAPTTTSAASALTAGRSEISRRGSSGSTAPATEPCSARTSVRDTVADSEPASAGMSSGGPSSTADTRSLATAG